MNLKIKVTKPEHTPTRAYWSDAGLDLRATETTLIQPGEIKAISTGVYAEIPTGYVGLLFARSGNAAKKGLGLANGVGVIDSGYRGEIKALMTNFSPFTRGVEDGERIAQLLIMPIVIPDIEIAEELDETDRGECGFGSTGR